MTPPTVKLSRSKSLAPEQLVHPGQSLGVDSEVETASGLVYRRVLYLAITTDPLADTIVLDNPALTFNFDAARLTTRQYSAFLAEPWSWRENRVVAKFRRPWRVEQVLTSQSGFVHLFRVDGDAMADEATTSAYSGESFDPEFIGVQFAMDFLAAVKPPRGFTAQVGRDGAIGVGVQRSRAAGAQVAGPAIPELLQVDPAQVGTELIGVQGFHHVSGIVLRSYPTTPRVSLPVDLAADDNLLTGVGDVPLDLLWLQAGENHSTVLAELGARLEQVLIPKLTDAYPALAQQDAPVWVPVVLESDTPCLCALGEISLPYRQVINRFQDRSKKAILKFDGQRLTPQLLPLTVPPGNVTRLGFKLDVANRDRLSCGSGPAAAGAHCGLLVSEDYWYGVLVTPPTAGFYGAVALLLSPLSATAELTLALVAGDGAVSGAALVSASAPVARNGSRQWLRIAFPEQRLDQTSYWLTLKATGGRVVWLGSPGTATVQRMDQRVAGSTARAVAGLAPAYDLLPVDNSLARHPLLFTLEADATPLDVQSDNARYQVVPAAGLKGGSSLHIRQAAAGQLTFLDPFVEYIPP